MIFHEERMDLLKVPQGWRLAHCISADYALGAGVAKQIDQAFNMREMLRKNFGVINFRNTGACCVVGGNVFNLITKDKYWQKPSIEALHSALLKMKSIALRLQVKKIAMPRIGCGLDRLNWADVKPLIQEVFEDTDIEIMICYL